MTDMSMKAYRTPPSLEKKAATELRRLGIKAYVPRHKTEVRVSKHTKKRIIKYNTTAPGYVCARRTHFQTNYVRNSIGRVSTTDLHRLYRIRKIERKVSQQFSVGDTITVPAGPYADLTGKIVADHKSYVEIMTKGAVRSVKVRKFHMKTEPV